jgi:hypothetical protein
MTQFAPQQPGTVGATPAGATPVDVSQQLDLIHRQQVADARVQELAKSPAAAYLLWFFLGAFGGHRFYLKSKGVAFGMLFTLGGLGVWALVDVFFIGGRLRKVNRETRREVYAQCGLPLV